METDKKTKNNAELMNEAWNTVFKNYDISTLTFKPLSTVSAYFTGIKHEIDKERRGICKPVERLTWEEFCFMLFSSDEAKKHFNIHNFKLFIQFLEDRDNNFEDFNYFSEPIFEMNLVEDILFNLFTDIVFDVEQFHKTTTFEEVLVCYEIVINILEAIYKDFLGGDDDDSK